MGNNPHKKRHTIVSISKPSVQFKGSRHFTPQDGSHIAMKKALHVDPFSHHMKAHMKSQFKQYDILHITSSLHIWGGYTESPLQFSYFLSFFNISTFKVLLLQNTACYSHLWLVQMLLLVHTTGQGHTRPPFHMLDGSHVTSISHHEIGPHTASISHLWMVHLLPLFHTFGHFTHILHFHTVGFEHQTDFEYSRRQNSLIFLFNVNLN